MFNLDKYVKQFRALEKKSPSSAMRLLRNCLGPELLRVEQKKSYRRIKQQGAEQVGLSALGLRVYGHCKTAATAYWLLMGGKDREGKPLLLMKEKMPDGQLHFWVQTESGRKIDPTKAQLSTELYPHHNYSSGEAVRVGSNRGKSFVSLAGHTHRIDHYSYKLLQCLAKSLRTTNSD